MAADIEETAGSERQRKRKRVNDHRNLRLDDKVEVRSAEDGFLGSWHSGTVIACEDQIRQVQYDHLLCDDGLKNLIDSVVVSPIVDGIILVNWTPSNYRGLIRPLPPPIDFGKWCLHYGQCVDMYYDDAWWEGVIFDHEDGSEERNIFFPDMGDELKARTEMLRITQDWDELNEDWKPRGNWLFLELIEEVEKEWPLLVSVKQIWYEVRVKNGFENLQEWTSSARDIWKELVLQVILDNFKLTVKEFFHKLNSFGDLELEGQPSLELTEPALDALSVTGKYFGDSLAVVQFEATCQLDRDEPTDLNKTCIQTVEEEIDRNGLASVTEDGRSGMNLLAASIMPGDEEAQCVQLPILSILPSSQGEISRINSINHHERSSSTSSELPSRNLAPSKRRKSHKWLPAGHDIVPEAEFCPDAVIEYNNKCRDGYRPSHALALNIRKHISYLGWKIEFRRDNNLFLLRYTSPEPDGKSDGKKCYNSLRKVCQNLREPASGVLSSIPQDDQRSLATTPDRPFSSPSSEQPRVCKEAPMEPSPSDVIVVEPDYCPQAIVDYYSFGLDDKTDQKRGAKLKDIQLKAKKHLSAVGWSSYYTCRGGNKTRLRFTSPSGRSYSSLRKACEGCIDEGGISCGNACAHGRRPNINVKVKVQGIRKLRKKRKNGVLHHASHLLHTKEQNAFSPLLKKGNESGALIELTNNLNGYCPARVLRSSKRARLEVGSSSSHHTPRTVLSWLIDNNVILPRAKVHYRGRTDGRTVAEGRVTRDGIKCSCCQDVFSLTNFEAHAGSSYRRPAANIFLEDGRSLLECQLQLKRNVFRTESREVKNNRHHSKNDYICSVCHYGGELVLCDQCPSSFHKSCLGLKEVPDGDWFCPSCCCGICGQSRFNKDTKQFTDDTVLNCDQCEHQYHVGCLKREGLAKLDSYPRGNWFCNKRCEQIFLGLRKLLGKPVPVGLNNLTWTLLKYMKSEDSDHDASDIEDLTESYSKLNVALGVMHECFEPVQEPRTRRDLVEDVIFGRWSELNRLNFRGFYTVLLERNDELITVATVRVYGEKVAEVPLVGTRFQYRRLGMCRILMNELEKQLMELGVERLVLPAVPSVLNTWTAAFGFSMMTNSERLNFLDYSFLDFQGTIMCQKLLMKIPSRESRLSKRNQQKLCDDISGNDIIDFDGNSAVSEVFQAYQTEEIGIIDQRSMDIAGGDGNDGGDGTAPLVVEVNQPTNLDCIPCPSKITQECSVEAADHKEGENNGNVLFKCYKRRISACGS